MKEKGRQKKKGNLVRLVLQILNTLIFWFGSPRAGGCCLASRKVYAALGTDGSLLTFVPD